MQAGRKLEGRGNKSCAALPECTSHVPRMPTYGLSLYTLIQPQNKASLVTGQRREEPRVGRLESRGKLRVNRQHEEVGPKPAYKYKNDLDDQT